VQNKNMAKIEIVGALSAFGALAVALFILSGGASIAGQTALASTTAFWAQAVILIAILGAAIAMAKRLGII
jgi:hypothetical protein